MVDLAALIARIELRHLTPRVTLRYADSAYGPLIVISRDVLDRHTGAPREVSVAYTLPLFEPSEFISVPWTESRALAYIRNLIAGNLGHEVSEAFHFDGRRIFDPHAGA